jgi:hypothetical protein
MIFVRRSNICPADASHAAQRLRRDERGRRIPRSSRRGAIRLAQLGDQRRRRLAEDLGTSDVTLRHWLKQETAERGERAGGLNSDERDELQRLRDEDATAADGPEDPAKSGGLLREGRTTGGRRGVLVHRRGEDELPVAVMCRVLGVSRTGFHNWERRAPSHRALSDAWMTERIREVHDASRGVYGLRRSTPSSGSGTRSASGASGSRGSWKGPVSRAPGPASGGAPRSGSRGSHQPPIWCHANRGRASYRGFVRVRSELETGAHYRSGRISAPTLQHSAPARRRFRALRHTETRR